MSTVAGCCLAAINFVKLFVFSILNDFEFKGFSRLGTLFFVGLAAASMALPSKVDATPIFVPFNADMTASLAAPTVGLAENDNNYLFTRATNWTTLEKDLTGEKTGLELSHTPFPYTQDGFTAKDAASFNNDYMFQLGTDNGVRKINTSTGALSLPFDVVDAGNNAFGIGYDALSNTIGVGIYDAGNMTFKLLDGSTGS